MYGKCLTQRERDELVGKNQEKYFYLVCKHIFDDAGLGSTMLIDTQDLQVEGVDVILTFNNGATNYIDVKSFGYGYLENDDGYELPTFSQEILTKNKAGNWMKGWFINDDLRTSHYAYLYALLRHQRPDGTEVIPENMTVYDIIASEIYIVEKYKLLSHLFRNGLSSDVMLQNAIMLRDNAIRYGNAKESTSTTVNNFKFTYSGKKQEQPVNVLVRRPVLEELSDFHFVITQDELGWNSLDVKKSNFPLSA